MVIVEDHERDKKLKIEIAKRIHYILGVCESGTIHDDDDYLEIGQNAVELIDLIKTLDPDKDFSTLIL